MSRILSNKRGITLIEGLIAILITSVGLMALLSMQSPAWRLSGKSDYMGRGAGILSQELNARELFVMNPCNAVTAGTTIMNVNTSGQAAAVPGDATFQVTTIQTDITPAGIAAGTIWRVDVTVNWTGNAFALSDSVVVTRQESFRYGGC